MTGTASDVITISRQLGSGGSYLGQRIAQQLGFSYADRQILQRASEQLGIDEACVADRNDRLQSSWDRLFQFFAVGNPEGTFSPPPLTVISDEQLLRGQRCIIEELANRGSCVIVGHGSFHLLRGHPRALHVFAHASKKFRQERVMRLYGISSATEAERILDKADQDRENYIRKLAGRNWFDARNYHLSLDTSRIGFDESERIILSLVGTPGNEVPQQTSIEDTEP